MFCVARKIAFIEDCHISVTQCQYCEECLALQIVAISMHFVLYILKDRNETVFHMV